MRTLCFALVAAGLPVLASVASAGEQQRYELRETDNGYVRLDTSTGEMSICEQRGSQLVCRMAADERMALQDEIDRLNESLRALDERVAALEKAPPVAVLPSEEQFDRTLGYMQRFFRGFMDIMKEYDRDQEPSATPQRT
ncbi:MAG: hypothetical protein IT533_07375 [Hyphomicrobiales bacterium]|jgi:hypothetical protein|nr:hypothetical protein [Hyphomicrobiales bacterium]